jgi:hypothetical protein
MPSQALRDAMISVFFDTQCLVCFKDVPWAGARLRFLENNFPSWFTGR